MMFQLLFSTLILNYNILSKSMDTFDVDSIPFQTDYPGNWTFHYGEKYVTFYMNGCCNDVITFRTGAAFEPTSLDDIYIISLESWEALPIKLYLNKKNHKIEAFTLMGAQYSGIIRADDKSYMNYEMVLLDMIQSFRYRDL
ncbi:MAG: hypothetical protein ACLRZ7_06370 [Lachnospiraceae bacterium]